MFEHGEYVQVVVNGNEWVTCRIFRIIKDMVIAKRADGFTWLGVIDYVRPV
jgi:hypothetical protein